MPKDNIQMQVLGMGWNQFKTQWSHNGIQKTVEDLTEHLVQIIRAERNLFVPEKPPVPIPRRSSNIILGKITSKAKELNKGLVDKEAAFDRSAREM